MTSEQALTYEALARPVALENYREVFEQAPLARWTRQHLLYAGLATLGMLMSSVPARTRFSRLRWRGRNAAFLSC